MQLAGAAGALCVVLHSLLSCVGRCPSLAQRAVANRFQPEAVLPAGVPFLGLRPEPTGQCLVAGDGPPGTWFYAVGSFAPWNGGIPGSDSLTGEHVSELFVRNYSSSASRFDVRTLY